MIRDATQKRQKHFFSLEELKNELHSFWLKNICQKLLPMKRSKMSTWAKKG